jgi:predicted metallopeptidase
MKQLGNSSSIDLIKMIVKGLMSNIPATPSGALRPDQTNRPDLVSLKRKTVKRKSW